MRAFALVLVALLAATHVGAQMPIGFRGALGVEAMRGNPDSVFQGDIRAEFSVLYRWRHVYTGLGLSWVSFPV